MKGKGFEEEQGHLGASLVSVSKCTRLVCCTRAEQDPPASTLSRASLQASTSQQSFPADVAMYVPTAHQPRAT